MKFTKFGKALLMSALSAGILLSVTSCVESYTVGFLYVTGTVTSQSGGDGIISGFRIDHNTGKLTAIDGLPISSGGANPGRAVLLTGSRFLYVLNRGVNAQGGTTCTTADPCQNSNIEEFAVGGNGILTPQETFFTQGINPFRILGDSSGNFLYVLDHDSPSSAACALALGASATSCGDITAFRSTRPPADYNWWSTRRSRLPTVRRSLTFQFPPIQSTSSSPPISSSFSAELQRPAIRSSPTATASISGQLTVSQNTSQPLNIKQATAIVLGGAPSTFSITSRSRFLAAAHLLPALTPARFCLSLSEPAARCRQKPAESFPMTRRCPTPLTFLWKLKPSSFTWSIRGTIPTPQTRRAALRVMSSTVLTP